jgi:hypothetical protein
MLPERYSGQRHVVLPSLAKCVTIGAAVLAPLLALLNSPLVELGRSNPSTPAAMPQLAASSVERMRAQEATQATAVIPYTPPVEPEEPARTDPAHASEPASITTATPREDGAARAERLAQKKMQAERARKQRLARERARAQQRAASAQQNQLQYGYAAQPTFGPFSAWGQPQR